MALHTENASGCGVAEAVGLSKRTYVPAGALKASLPELKARPGWRKSESGIRWMNSSGIAAGIAGELWVSASWAEAEGEAPGALCSPVSGCIPLL